MPARHERKMKKMEKRSAEAWGSAMAGLREAEPERDEAEPEPELPAAPEGGTEEVWTVLEDRTLREYPQETSKKLGTVAGGTEVLLLETATDAREKTRLRVRAGSGAEGWVSKDTGKGRVAMVLNRKASSARQSATPGSRDADLRTLLQRQQQAQGEETSRTALTPRPAVESSRGCCCGRNGRRRVKLASSTAAP